MNTEIIELQRQLTLLTRRVDELVKPEVGRWVDWTPVITQLGNVTRTITHARYQVNDNAVHIECQLSVTGTGTTANAIIISGIPTVAQPVNVGFTAIGSGVVVDASVTRYVVTVIAVGVNDFRFQSTGVGAAVGVAPAFALASGDIITFQATYERG